LKTVVVPNNGHHKYVLDRSASTTDELSEYPRYVSRYSGRCPRRRKNSKGYWKSRLFVLHAVERISRVVIGNRDGNKRRRK